MKTSKRFLLTIGLALLGSLLSQSHAFASRDMDGRTSKVHGPIAVHGATSRQVRLAVLLGMLNNKGIKWTMDGETADTIAARWDYRGGVVLFDIRYTANEVRILYRDASENYVCKELAEGVCHKNGSLYYNYMPNLRDSISQELKRMGILGVNK